MSQIFTIAGLSCQSCVGHVSGALTALPGVTAVRVELDVDGPSMVHIEAGRVLAESEVETALAEEGDYTIVR